jgi:hypothetical protein
MRRASVVRARLIGVTDPFAAEQKLIAPSWLRWGGVPLAGACALVVALTAPHAERTSGLAISASAALLWIVAAALGAIKVRRRDQDRTIWVLATRIAIMLIVAFAITGFIQSLRSSNGLAHVANWLSALLCGAALGAITTWRYSACSATRSD